MALREHLLAVAEELRRLKSEGAKSVSIGDDTLAHLHRLVPKFSGPPTSADPASAVSLAVKPVTAKIGVASNLPAAEIPQDRTPSEPPARPVSVRLPSREGSPSAKSESVPRAPAPEAGLPPSPALEIPPGDKQTRWNWLRDFVVNHPVCRAHVRPGKKVVLGVGSLDADLFFCGEAPGADEEIQGEPFVGAAGQLLTKMIKAMGLERSQVYIGNIMNWRPEMPTPPGMDQTGNRPPTAEEMAFCLPFLKAQLAIVAPKVIVALGATAASGLLGAGSFKALGDIRGRWHTFAGLPVMVTYHPSYLLRDQSIRKKRVVWEDLIQVMERANLPINERQRGFFLER